MPQRATSRGLLLAGAALVLAACPLIAVPVLRDRAETAQARQAVELMASIDETAPAGVAELRRQYGAALNEILAAGSASEQFARALFGIAGVSFALG